ncbi:MAG: hypothetical protein ABUT39_04175 [Acidobacteriota bacterium]
MAATDGAPAAAQEAERRFSDRDRRRAALEEASGTLIQTRRYPEAAALLEQAGRQGGNAAELLGRAETLRKARRHEELSYPPSDPAGVVKGLLLLMGSDSVESKAFLASFSRGLRDELDADDDTRKAIEEVLSSFTSSMGDGEIPLDTVLDLGLGSLETSISGDDDRGHRIVLTMLDQKMEYYVVREEDGYRIAGSDQTLFALGLEALRRLDRGDAAGARQWLDWAREKIPAAGGDDPLASSPFSTLWTRGAEASAEEARCAAASLVARLDLKGRTVPILVACRDAAPEGPRRTALDLALVVSYLSAKRHAEAAEAARLLAAAHPDSARAYNLLSQELIALKSWDEVRRLAEERLVKLPDDVDALQYLCEAAEQKNDIQAADGYLQRIVDAGKANSVTFNNIAWHALFLGKADERAVELAQRAVTLDGYANSFSLHTLASLYAEQGKTAEAYQLILQSLQAGSGELDGDDWYVFGRLAEHYGLPDAARRYYARVEPVQPGQTDSTSTYKLAHARLAGLPPEARPAKPGRKGR